MLLRIGYGTEEYIYNNYIRLPSNMIISNTNGDVGLNKLIDNVFSKLETYAENIDLMANRVILTPRNDYVDDVNNILVDRFPGDPMIYYSCDEYIDKDRNDVQEDFLNNLVPNGFPPHEY